MAGKARLTAYRAPGRVNIIGEHTDYNGGFVLPIAIGLGCVVTPAPLRKRELRAVSAQLPGEMVWRLDEIPRLPKQGNWGDYVLGVAKELIAAGFEISPAKLTIDATVPPGSGLSSSAALEVSTALALLGGRAMPKLDLARLCQRAERNHVGMPCGIMDQYVSVHGEKGKAILLDCRSITHQAVPLPDGVTLVAVNTMVKHELGSSAYSQRVKECAEALSHFPGKETLRDVTLGELERTASSLPEVPLSRARHVILECWRVQQFMDASSKNDLARMGSLMVESHRSLKDDYEVSCEELDFLVGAALSLDGVYGARMTGGGFGGCTVNLLRRDAVAAFDAEITRRYQERFQITPTVYHCDPAAGAGPV